MTLRDLPHLRCDCLVHKISIAPASFCPNCYCYVCDIKACECKSWGNGSQPSDHCHAKKGCRDWEMKRREVKNPGLMQQPQPQPQRPTSAPPAAARNPFLHPSADRLLQGPAAARNLHVSGMDLARALFGDRPPNPFTSTITSSSQQAHTNQARAALDTVLQIARSASAPSPMTAEETQRRIALGNAILTSLRSNLTSSISLPTSLPAHNAPQGPSNPEPSPCKAPPSNKAPSDPRRPNVSHTPPSMGGPSTYDQPPPPPPPRPPLLEEQDPLQTQASPNLRFKFKFGPKPPANGP